MDYTKLGKTGLTVSVAGLGCGGNSRLGLGTGATEAEAVALVRSIMDEGVTFFDTAEAYGTETVIGRAVAEAGRDRFVISTKSRARIGGRLLEAGDVVANLDASLRRLGTDHIDVFHLHAVPPDLYDHVRDRIVPAMLKEKEKGKFRHLGITETSPRDPEQRMLPRALSEDDCWEVVMFAFHMLHQRARRTIFPLTMEKGVGTLLMFVVRNIFSRPAVLERTIEAMIEDGRLDAGAAAPGGALDFLLHPGETGAVTDAAYRFARHEPGADVVLFGTGNPDHARANIRSILKPPLPEAQRDSLAALFGDLSGIGLDLPDRIAVSRSS